jgi:uncharacterized coiled-coil protein SlyX
LSIATDFDAKLLDIRLLMEQQNHATEERLNRMELTVKHQQNTIEQITRRLDSATISVDAQKTTANALLEQRLKRLEDSLIHSRPDSNEKDFVKRKDFDRLEKLVNKCKLIAPDTRLS